MTAQDDIAAAIARARDYLKTHPDAAESTDTEARATIENGLRCRVEGPNGAVVTTDMVRAVGGAGSAPSPGWLLRAAFASCDATLIAMRAAEEGIVLTRLDVIVDSVSDDRGLLGADDSVPAGPLRSRVRIAIAADAVGENRLREIVDWARRHSPVDDALGRAVPIDVQVAVGP